MRNSKIQIALIYLKPADDIKILMANFSWCTYQNLHTKSKYLFPQLKAFSNCLSALKRNLHLSDTLIQISTKEKDSSRSPHYGRFINNPIIQLGPAGAHTHTLGQDDEDSRELITMSQPCPRGRSGHSGLCHSIASPFHRSKKSRRTQLT